MVLESLFSPFRAERKPWELFFVGMLYSSVAIFLSIWIFKEHASLVMVFLTVAAAIPLMYHTMKYEEKVDLKLRTEYSMLRHHARAIAFFVFMFMGFVVSLSIWYLILPPSMVDSVFSVQTQTIRAINTQLSGGYLFPSIFYMIFFNNVKVLLFSLFFSFFYGAGAIFILTWNASVISAAVGNFSRNLLAEAAKSLGYVGMWNYLSVLPISLMRYFIHGLPEITAYFIGGLAGGIISVAVIKHDFMGDNFRKIMRDAFDLTAIAIFILFIAALLEVFVTPIFF